MVWVTFGWWKCLSSQRRGIRRFDLRTPTTFPSLALRLRRLSGGGGRVPGGGASERFMKPRGIFPWRFFSGNPQWGAKQKRTPGNLPKNHRHVFFRMFFFFRDAFWMQSKVLKGGVLLLVQISFFWWIYMISYVYTSVKEEIAGNMQQFWRRTSYWTE